MCGQGGIDALAKKQEMKIRVECYSGFKADERPVPVFIDNGKMVYEGGHGAKGTRQTRCRMVQKPMEGSPEIRSFTLISMFWYCVVGCASTMLFGWLCSLLPSCNRRSILLD